MPRSRAAVVQIGLGPSSLSLHPLHTFPQPPSTAPFPLSSQSINVRFNMLPLAPLAVPIPVSQEPPAFTPGLTYSTGSDSSCGIPTPLTPSSPTSGPFASNLASTATSEATFWDKLLLAVYDPITLEAVPPTVPSSSSYGTPPATVCKEQLLSAPTFQPNTSNSFPDVLTAPAFDRNPPAFPDHHYYPTFTPLFHTQVPLMEQEPLQSSKEPFKV